VHLYGNVTPTLFFQSFSGFISRSPSV
jgi:hypothetical protein